MKVLVNNGRRRLGIPGHPAIILVPGESIPVDKTQIAEMHKNRTVVRWLNSGVLEICNEGDVKSLPKKPAHGKRPAKILPRAGRRNDHREPVVLPKGVTGKGVELHHKGGGWFEVWVNGFRVTDKNIRKPEAEEIATEYE